MSVPTGGSGSSWQSVRTAIAAALAEHDGGTAQLAGVCQACVQLLPVDGASISVILDTAHREVLHASDEIAAMVESVQFTLGEGPCFEAFETGRPVLAPDLATTSTARWPTFASEVSQQPIGAIFAFPLQTGAARVGAIDMYRRLPGWLSAEELTVALHVADVATATLLTLQDDASVADGAWLDSLPRDREVVHQATGMLIAEFGISAAQALSRLRAHAFGTGELVEDLARRIVARELPLHDIYR